MIIKKLHIVGIALAIFFALTAVSMAAGNRHVVLIDPGHGGKDEGVRLSKSVCEKDITLEIAKLTKEKLSGYKNLYVELTRSKDKEVDISDRKVKAAKLDADLVVSLHVNAGFGGTSDGYEIYLSNQESPTSGKSDSKEIVRDMTRNKTLNDSVRFAQIVQGNISKVFPREGRGIRPMPVIAIELSDIPAVLIELGFATNLDDKKKLSNEKVRKSIADALSKSIAEFF